MSFIIKKDNQGQGDTKATKDEIEEKDNLAEKLKPKIPGFGLGIASLGA